MAQLEAAARDAGAARGAHGRQHCWVPTDWDHTPACRSTGTGDRRLHSDGSLVHHTRSVARAAVRASLVRLQTGLAAEACVQTGLGKLSVRLGERPQAVGGVARQVGRPGEGVEALRAEVAESWQLALQALRSCLLQGQPSCSEHGQSQSAAGGEQAAVVGGWQWRLRYFGV